MTLRRVPRLASFRWWKSQQRLQAGWGARSGSAAAAAMSDLPKTAVSGPNTAAGWIYIIFWGFWSGLAARLPSPPGSRGAKGAFLRRLHRFWAFPLKQELERHVAAGNWKLLAKATNPNHHPPAGGRSGSAP